MSDHFSGPRSLTDLAADLTDMYAFPAAVHAKGSTRPCRTHSSRREVLRISRPLHALGIGFALLMTRVHLPPVIRGAGLACVLAGA